MLHQLKQTASSRHFTFQSTCASQNGLRHRGNEEFCVCLFLYKPAIKKKPPVKVILPQPRHLAAVWWEQAHCLLTEGITALQQPRALTAGTAGAPAPQKTVKRDGRISPKNKGIF